MTGVYVVVAALVLAIAFGLYRRATDGRVRTAAGTDRLDASLLGADLGSEVTFVQFSTVALAGAAITLAMPWPAFTIGAAGGWSLAYCAVFPTVICFTLQNAFQRFTTPTRAGLIYTLDPVWSMLAGVFILGERLTPRELVGCMLILVAVAGPLLGRLYLEQRHRRLYHLDDVEEA